MWAGGQRRYAHVVKASLFEAQTGQGRDLWANSGWGMLGGWEERGSRLGLLEPILGSVLIISLL